MMLCYILSASEAVWLAAMPAQAAQLQADGAEDCAAGSPQISEAEEQDSADTRTEPAQEDGPAEPLKQAAGSQAQPTMPLPVNQGEVIWHAKSALNLVCSWGPCRPPACGH